MYRKLINWFREKQPEVALFNFCILVLVLLHSAGYFHPYFTITINVVVIVSIVLAIVILRAKNIAILMFTLVMLLTTAFFKLTHIDVWSERVAIYFFEGLLAFAIYNVTVEMLSLLSKGKKAIKNYFPIKFKKG